MEPGSICYTCKDGLLVLKFSGCIRIASREACRLSAALDAFVRRLPERADFQEVLIDLAEASAIDSTHLGLIAELARVTRLLGRRRPTILSAGEDMTLLLESVGFDQIFDVLRGPGESRPDLDPLAGIDMSEQEHLRLMLQAHRTLAEIQPGNAVQFRNVIEVLEEEQARQRCPSE